MKAMIDAVGPYTLRFERDRFAMLVRSIVTQQISTIAARAIRKGGLPGLYGLRGCVALWCGCGNYAGTIIAIVPSVRPAAAPNMTSREAMRERVLLSEYTL